MRLHQRDHAAGSPGIGQKVKKMVKSVLGGGTSNRSELHQDPADDGRIGLRHPALPSVRRSDTEMTSKRDKNPKILVSGQFSETQRGFFGAFLHVAVRR